MIRDFGKSNDANVAPLNVAPAITPEAPMLDGRPVIVEERTFVDEPAEGMRPFHIEAAEDYSNNTAKIIGGVVVGLLIIGGGIYAYQTTRATPVQQVALKAPTQNPAALNQAAATPPASMPDNTMPPPALTPAATPAPKPSHPVVKQAMNDHNTPSPKQAVEDLAITAPMTLTPETAPPPQEATGQAALQQPLTAPDVTDQANQPQSAVANNDLPQVTPPAIQPQLQPQIPLPPAQIPADQAQLPSAQ